MEKPATYENDDNLKATELSLSLPGSHHETNRNKRSAQPEKLQSSPPNKSQVVGWPPVRSYRKNVLQPKKPEIELAAGMYVKVSMDGAPYLRKIDLNVYKNYEDLLIGLQTMFKCSINEIAGDSNGGEYVTTYEDKDEDWMLAGDVPWNMFVSSCKRIRIMKGTEAKGLGSP